MASDTKLLQAILNNQNSLSEKIDHLDQKVVDIDQRIDSMDKKIDGHTERLDKIGGQLAYLEDDAPTIKEFNQLKRKVKKLESVVYKQA